MRLFLSVFLIAWTRFADFGWAFRYHGQGLEALLGRREPFVPEELAPKQIE